MSAYVALFRGINVGAHNRIAVTDLRGLMVRSGYTGVQSHLNSGKLIFTSPERAREDIAIQIEAAITVATGMEVPVTIRSGAGMQRVVTENPFPGRASDPTTLHVAFLPSAPDATLIHILAVHEKGNDDYRIVGDNICLSYPNGVSGAVFTPKALRKRATSRTWKVICRLADMTPSSFAPVPSAFIATSPCAFPVRRYNPAN